MEVRTEDITVGWGQAPHPLDAQMGKWRLAIFQDVQESIDQTKLYYLYDPIAEDEANQSRKGNQCLVIFDTNLRCFAHEIPLFQVPGRVKFLFALKCPSPLGGSAFVLVTETQNYGQINLHFHRLDLSQNGCEIANCRPLTNQPLSIGGEFIVSMREDAPEAVVLANPGLQVWQINCMAENPQPPTANFTVPGAELTHFYDGFLNDGKVYLLSASPDGHLDYTRVHVLHLASQGVINTHSCKGDPQRGFPPARKQAAIDSVPGYILLAGGEMMADNYCHRLIDYWVLDCAQFQWTQVPAQMPCPLIEPRLTACHSGTVYLWGDFDQPLPGMPNQGTHLRIMKITGFNAYKTPPPSYDQTVFPRTSYDQYKSAAMSPDMTSSTPSYPSVYPSNPVPAGISDSFPCGGSASCSQAPPYPSYNPTNQPPNPVSYDTSSYGGPTPYQSPTSQPSDGMHAYYPPQKDKKKCSIQ